jgi:rod shape-determining protein MreC
MVSDYKFNIFSQVKSVINLALSPINLIAQLPHNLHKSLLQPQHISDNSQELLILKAKLQKFNSLLLENQRLLSIAGNDYLLKDDDFIITKITKVNKSRLRKNIIIDHGANSNLTIGNVVIGELGVIGTITDVYNASAMVRLITDPLQYIPVINTRSGEKAVAKGFAISQDLLIINFVRPDADIKLGDIFATSGDGLLFGYGYNVGEVVEINQDSQNFLSIVLKPAQEINKTIFAIVDKDS